MIQPISASLFVMAGKPAAATAAAGKSFSQVLQELPGLELPRLELPRLGKIAAGTAAGFLTGGPAGAAMGGALTLLQAK